jgi:predicted PurR-regulated permease PerM
MTRVQPDRFGVALTWGGLALLVYFVYLVVAPFLPALGWAAVFAILFQRLFVRLTRRWSRSSAAIVTTLTAAVVLIVPMVALVVAFTQQALQAADNLHAAFSGEGASRLNTLWHNILMRLPAAMRSEVSDFLADALRGLGTSLVSESGQIARSAVGFVANLVIALFATFFVLRDSDVIMRGIRRLLPMGTAQREALIVRTEELITVGVVSSLVVAAVQGLLGGIVFALLGLSAPIFWGVVMALFCLLPLGAWVIWMPTAIVLALNGDVIRGVILAVAGLVIVSGVDNVLRPMMISGRANMNGLVILVSLLGGVAVFGLLGLVLGPIIIVTALALLDSYMQAPDDQEKAVD